MDEVEMKAWDLHLTPERRLELLSIVEGRTAGRRQPATGDETEGKAADTGEQIGSVRPESLKNPTAPGQGEDGAQPGDRGGQGLASGPRTLRGRFFEVDRRADEESGDANSV